MIKHKKLSSKSGLTIPKDMRLDKGLLPGMAVDLISTEDGILIRKHLPTCGRCGSIHNVVSCGKDDLCQTCILEFMESAKEKGLEL